jgi:hypothetical protein
MPYVFHHGSTVPSFDIPESKTPFLIRETKAVPSHLGTALAQIIPLQKEGSHNLFNLFGNSFWKNKRGRPARKRMQQSNYCAKAVACSSKLG